MANIEVIVNPEISPDQLWDFYVKNNICEVGYGKETAAIPLKHSSLIIGAFEEKRLVGIARAMFDGTEAAIMEFCLDLKLQGDNLKYNNGSLIEKDTYGIGKRMGELLINKLYEMGASFFSYCIVENCEEEFFRSIGFTHNRGSFGYIIDRRPYVI